MAIVFFLVAVLFFIALIIGMVRPGVVIRWGPDNPLHKSRKKVALIYGGGLIFFFIAFLIVAPKQAEYNLVAEPIKGQVPLEVTFKATSNKSLEENFEEIKWRFGDGKADSGKEVNHIYEQQGDHEVVLNLIGDEESKKITKTITVTNSPPEAVISSNKKSGYPPLEVEFDASQSRDRDDSIKKYKWDFGESTKEGTKVTKTFKEPGTYQAKLTVTDEDQDSDTKVRNIEVKKPTPEAKINASKTSGYKPLKVRFNAKGSTTPRGEIVEYAWDFGDGESEKGFEVSHTFRKAGEFDVTLTAISDTSYEGNISKKIEVGNRSPESSLQVADTEGLKVKFDLTDSQDPDGSIERYKIWFGDGQFKEGTGKPDYITHVYGESGVYQAELEVTDDTDASSPRRVKQVKAGNIVLVDGEEKKYYPPQSKVFTEKFSFSVHKEPRYEDNLGGTFGKSASEGAVFLLVPVKITNETNESESLSLTTSWEVIDLNQGYTYEVATGADMYLDSSERLETHRIPPQLSRDGYIVFEINKSSRNNRLVLEKEAGVLFSSSYYFAINFQ